MRGTIAALKIRLHLVWPNRILHQEWSDVSTGSQCYDFFNACSKCFPPIKQCKTYSRTMPPGGDFDSINGNILSVLNLISMTLVRNVYSMMLGKFVEFQRDPSVRTRDFADFHATVSLNEMGFKHGLQSESRKSKPSYHHHCTRRESRCSRGNLCCAKAYFLF